MKKRVLLLAVSCKHGGLCPGGIDLDNPKEWIRIVKDDGQSGAVQGYEIDFAKPLDIIEFEGRPMPQGKQKENWVIDNNSCKKVGTEPPQRVVQAYREYSYHGFWNNSYAYLTEDQLEKITHPSESIMVVSDVRLYKNNNGKAKIDFKWDEISYPIRSISLTDQDFYDQLDNNAEICYQKAIIVVSIPKNAEWPVNGERRAYKFVSKVFPLNESDFHLYRKKVTTKNIFETLKHYK